MVPSHPIMVEGGITRNAPEAGDRAAGEDHRASESHHAMVVPPAARDLAHSTSFSSNREPTREVDMNEVVRQAEAALRRHAAPALRLRELLRLVRARTSDRTLDARLLITLLQEHPDRFRILDPWQGPWRLAGIEGDTGEGAEDPWVVLVTDPGEQDLADPRLAARLRESVRWMARGIDPRARRELIRWHAMMIAEEDARALLVRRAA